MRQTFEQIINKAISDCKAEGGDVYNLFECFLADINISRDNYKEVLSAQELSTEMKIEGDAYLFMLDSMEQLVMDYAEKEDKSEQTVVDHYDEPLAAVMANLNALCADDDATSEQLDIVIQSSQLIQANYCRDNATMQEAIADLADNNQIAAFGLFFYYKGKPQSCGTETEDSSISI